jgi:hypothetical protein
MKSGDFSHKLALDIWWGLFHSIPDFMKPALMLDILKSRWPDIRDGIKVIHAPRLTYSMLIPIPPNPIHSVDEEELFPRFPDEEDIRLYEMYIGNDKFTWIGYGPITNTLVYW